MNSIALAGLLPVAVFLVVALAVALIARRQAARGTSAGGVHAFVDEYFLGNRTLGPFVLAMTTIATYGSVSSFVGGPGQAWSIGWGWVYMAGVQVTALFLLYGILGKKMGLVSRRLGAVTVIDVIRERYQSNALAAASALIIVVFFAATMVAQFVGGAKLFEAVTGYSYVTGLAIFGIAAILFTTIGGFRGVAFTDALCGIAMIVGIVVLAGGILSAGGGYANIMDTIAANHPEMMEPLSGGAMPVGLYFTQWLLVGVFTFCLPQSVVRTLSYRDTKSLHRAMIWGTVNVGFMMIGVTSLGVLSAGVL
ncbi:MAG: sodium/panthothenate symporter, partial [Eggerthellaceae bacterium]|nr:sodium/panthothenate symporter [Eggerthellaceae bacterium]